VWLFELLEEKVTVMAKRNDRQTLKRGGERGSGRAPRTGAVRRKRGDDDYGSVRPEKNPGRHAQWRIEEDEQLYEVRRFGGSLNDLDEELDWENQSDTDQHPHR
jgi:hypothetical protein